MTRRSASSARWLREHETDRYVQSARREGYRSRAVYKLDEIDRRDRLLARGAVVLDLGAAPGGWSQLAAARVGPGGRVLAVDRLPIEPLEGVEAIAGDLYDREVVGAVTKALGGAQATVVLSDMAPDATGIAAIDQPRTLALAELALETALAFSAPGAAFLVKVFEGEGLDAFRGELRRHYRKVVGRKPGASRARSRELYLLALGRAV